MFSKGKSSNELFLNNEDNIKKWFKNIDNVDEHVYISLLHHYNLQKELILTNNIAAGAIILSQWSDMKNYKRFDKSYLSKDSPNEYDEICDEELEYFVNSKSLFARKFTENCDLQYLYKLLKI